MLEAGSGLTEGTRLPPGLLARAGAHRPGVRGPAQVPEADRRPDASEGAKRARDFYEAVLEFDERPDLARAQRRLGPRVGRGGRDGQARRDDLPRREHRPRQPVRRLRREGRHRRPPGDRGRQLPALQPHPPAGHRRRRPLHPGLPAALPLNDPTRTIVRAAREANAAMPKHAVDLLERGIRRPPGSTGRGCWAPHIGAASRRRRSAASSPLVEELDAPRGPRDGHDPHVHRRRSCAALGFSPFDSAQPTRRRDRPHRPRGYRELRGADLPGARVILDGRNDLDAASFPDAGCSTVGQGDVLRQVVSVVGARPQLVKLAPVAKAFAAAGVEHTSAHRSALRRQDVSRLLRRPTSPAVGQPRGRLRQHARRRVRS